MFNYTVVRLVWLLLEGRQWGEAESEGGGDMEGGSQTELSL